MPALRFKDKNGQAFEAPDELTIQDLFDKVKTTNKDRANKNVITNSAEHGLIPQREFFDKDIAVEGNTSKYTIIKDGDFVYNPRKSSTAPYGPFNCYTREEPGIVSPLYSCLTPKNKAYTPYLLYYFASPAWYSYIYHNGNQGGARHDRVGMTDDLLQGIPVLLPCQEEQDKITAFLSLYDKRIAAQASKVEALEIRRKGLLQQIFSQEIRFKADDGSEFPDWEEASLESITEKVERKAPKDSTAPVMMISQGKGFIYQSEKYSQDNAGQSLKNYTLLKRNEMAYNHGASKAKPFGVTYSLLTEGEARVPFVYHTFRMLNGYPDFWNYALNTEYIDRQLKGLVSSSVRSNGLLNINYDTYMGITVLVPCDEEQKKISEFLMLIDKQVQLEKDKLEAIKQVKKGLLQQMFV